MIIKEGEFEKRIIWSPSFDRRDPDPGKDYGIGAVKLRFILKGPLGATQFVMSTGWLLKSLRDEGRKSEPVAYDIGYHSPVPRYGGHYAMPGICEVLGSECYYDGSTLTAGVVMDAFFENGEDEVWRILRDRYDELFVGVKP